jgi:tetratricopeptide (TPR) repeat protein
MKTSVSFHAIAVALAATGLSQPAAAGLFSNNSGAEESPAKIVQDARAYAARQDDWAQPFAYALYRDGEWGAVLNFQRLGLAAMQKQRPDIARKAFDQAIQRVEAIYANDANAAKARSVFNAEKVKDFKGEPYERAMLYYYRGLLYLNDGDFQNARASFLAADRHVSLSSAEESAYVSDFGMLKYLAGWASSCDGDSVRAEQLIAEARAADKLAANLDPRPPRSLILVDAGPAPVKWGDGTYHEVLKFKPGNGDDADFSIVAGKTPVASPQLAGDVTHQAMTRGGREVDGIMQGKARFKDNAGSIGSAAMAIGQQTAMLGAINGDRGTANAGLAGMLVGLVAKGVAASTTPAADTRTWDSLPGRVMLYAGADLTRGPVTITLEGRATPAALQATQGHCSFAWGHTRSALTTAMGGTVSIAEEKPLESDRGERNKALRAMLVSELMPAAQ